MRVNKQSSTGSVMAWTPLDKDGWGRMERREGANGLGQAVKSRVNCSPSSCIKFKGGWCTKLPLINCRQREWRKGRGGRARLWFGIRDQHIGPNDVIHQDGHCNLLSISSSIKLECLYKGLGYVFMHVCMCSCGCLLDTGGLQQSAELTWRA